MAEPNRLAAALRRAFNMVREDAEATATVVVGAFNGEDEVNDEDLDKDLRSLFYQLEKEQLLRVRRTEYKFEGQVRRAYFWSLNQLEGLRLDDAFGGALTRDDLEATKVYQGLGQDFWNRRSA